jgi:hypothetical protein
MRFVYLQTIASLHRIKIVSMAESLSNRTGNSATPLWKTELSKIKSLISCFSVSYREPNRENTNTLVLWNLQRALASMCGSLECEQMCRYCSKIFGSYSNPYSKIFYALLPIVCGKLNISLIISVHPTIHLLSCSSAHTTRQIILKLYICGL